MVTTEPLIGARIPDQSDGPLGGLQIANGLQDLIPYVTPRFASVAERNTKFAQWVAAGGVMEAGLQCFTTDVGLRWRYTGTAWFLDGWAGDDKTDQPMISCSEPSGPVNSVNTLYQVASWPSVVDNSGGLLTLTGGAIRCNVAGRVRVDALAVSDAASSGWSNLSILAPIGGGSTITALEDRRGRATGFPGAGALRQPISAGPIVVQPGDQFAYRVGQQNVDGASVAYQHQFAVTYV